MTSAVKCRPLNAPHWSSFIAHPPFTRAKLATSWTRRADLQQNLRKPQDDIGLEMGGDDYLSKPFSPRELVVRIGAILRRAKAESSTRGFEGSAQFGKYCFDHQQMTLTREGQPVPLSLAEARLLAILVQHAGEPMSRDSLMVLSRGRHHEPFDRTIDVQIGRLRKLIEDDPTRPRHLQTVWGKGYVLYKQ